MLQGPNCFGVMNMENGVILPFFGLHPGSVKTGGASFIGQSGGIFYDTSMLCSVERVGLNKLVSIGNKLALDENDFLEYLIADKGTKVIGMVEEDGPARGTVHTPVQLRPHVAIASLSSCNLLLSLSNAITILTIVSLSPAIMLERGSSATTS